MRVFALILLFKFSENSPENNISKVFHGGCFLGNFFKDLKKKKYRKMSLKMTMFWCHLQKRFLDNTLRNRHLGNIRRCCTKTTMLKPNFTIDVFVAISRIFLEHISPRTPLKGFFCYSFVAKSRVHFHIVVLR